MHIVQLFPGVVPPVDYGGIERVVFWVTRELVRRGHRVTLVARSDSDIESRVPGTRLVAWPVDIDDYRTLIPTDAEVAHFHAPPPLDQLPELPYISTEHGNRRKFRAFPPNTVFVGRNHARNNGGDCYVLNGVPVHEFTLCTDKDDYMIFMALLAMRSKNAKTMVHLAIDSGMPAVFAGGDLWKTRRISGWWKLRARYHRDLLREVGFVSGQVKLELLQRARLLFHLVNFHEPGALGPLEALACGTPVLASPNGVLPEYIEDGVNGFICRNYGEALAATKRVANMSAAQMAEMATRCRESTLSIESCVDGYLELYEKVVRDRYLYRPEKAKDLYYRRPRAKRIRCWLPRKL